MENADFKFIQTLGDKKIIIHQNKENIIGCFFYSKSFNNRIEWFFNGHKIQFNCFNCYDYIIHTYIKIESFVLNQQGLYECRIYAIFGTEVKILKTYCYIYFDYFIDHILKLYELNNSKICYFCRINKGIKLVNSKLSCYKCYVNFLQNKNPQPINLKLSYNKKLCCYCNNSNSVTSFNNNMICINCYNYHIKTKKLIFKKD